MASKRMTPEQVAFQNQTKLNLGRCIYRGDGDVYLLKGYPSRLVKIVPGDYRPVRKALSVLKYLQNSKNPAVVKIYHVGSFTATDNYYPRDITHYYYYVMEKLSLLPRKNREAHINQIYEAVECGYKVKAHMSRKVKIFVDKARQLKYTHRDIHDHNVMQNKRGSLKFVDLESFMYNY